MLKTHHQHFTELSEHSKFCIESSDVIEDLKIYVKEETSGKVIWYKERFLSDNEIIENVVENSTSKICWTIHMPKRGWYIRLTAPSFPLGIFIPLMPVPAASPYHAEAALQFSTRINPPKSKADPAVQDRSSMTLPPSLDSSSKEAGTRSLDSASIHSYPPTPHTSPPMSARISTETVNEKDSQKTLSSSTMTSRVSPPDIQQFILAPHSSPHVPESENTSFIAKALSVLKNNKPSHTLSFTLCPIPPKLSSAGQVSISAESSHSQHTSGEIIPTPQPLLIFHDRTPVWNFRSTTGLLEIDTSLEREMGVDRSFWVTIALAYLEFQTERESYMAAAGG